MPDHAGPGSARTLDSVFAPVGRAVPPAREANADRERTTVTTVDSPPAGSSPAPPQSDHLPGHPWHQAADLVLEGGQDRTPTWLSARRDGLGASDIAGVLGLSPWTTQLRVYLDKLGLAAPVEMNPAMEWGIRLEDAVATKFADDSGLEVVKTGMWRSKTWPSIPLS
ncbi:MAG TPA: YqaJ viral recombinase family protein [Pseudonocardiaceae bacterium]|jgi:hypothetical protein